MSKIENKISQVIAFGNSYSDNGEARRISSIILSNKNSPKDAFLKPTEGLYWNGRYSNGYAAIELLAKRLDVNLVSYATGGATSGKENYTDWMDTLGDTGVLGQIDRFEKNLSTNEIDSNALYFIFASENDYFAYMDFNKQGSIEELAYTVIDNIKNAIKKLAKIGAKKFFVVNCSDLSLVPYENTMNRTDSAKEFVKIVNENLPKNLKELQSELNVSIIEFDHTFVSNDIVQNPNKYALKVLTKEYQSTYPEIMTSSGDESEYYFWDEWHFSYTTNKIFANAMYHTILKRYR